MVLTRRAALKGIFVSGLGAVTGIGVYGVGYERHRIGVTSATLGVRGLPPAWDGVRVGLLTDVHHSALVPAADVANAVALVNAERPDLILLGGDYITNMDRAFADPVAELLAPLHAPLGIYAILGNHDDDREMPASLRSQHIEVLRDDRTRLEYKGQGLDLAGISFWTRSERKIKDVVKGARGPVLLLAHDPRRLVEAAKLNVAAVLSGHTHGGQIVLPGIGAIAARKFPVAAGNGSLQDTTIFVSRGIGTVYVPARINCPPEVAIITLQRT
jgi:predicted MPP superfamily phosphohydrolase